MHGVLEDKKQFCADPAPMLQSASCELMAMASNLESFEDVLMYSQTSCDLKVLKEPDNLERQGDQQPGQHSMFVTSMFR